MHATNLFKLLAELVLTDLTFELCGGGLLVDFSQNFI